MVFFPLLSDSLRHAVEFMARVFDLLLRLFQLLAVHLRERYDEPPVGALHDGGRHFQIARERGGLGGGRRLWLPLRFQKQLRRVEDALAHHARAFAPSRVDLPGFAGSTMMRGESGGHAFAIVQVDARHGN